MIRFFFKFCSVATAISNVMSPILFVLLLSYSITIAIFLVCLGLVNIFSLTAFATITALTDILTQMVIYCAYSENVTNDLVASGESFYESPWYQLPVKLQQFYILPIQRSQKEFRRSGLGIIECSLGVFVSVGAYFTHLTRNGPFL